MKDKIFLDTNVLIYFATDIGYKKDLVFSLISNSQNVTISIQVLNEFANTCLKKNLLTENELEFSISQFKTYFDIEIIRPNTILKALTIKAKFRFSYYDSLILASAMQAGCKTLYTEDMQHKQIIENQLTIINPFK